MATALDRPGMAPWHLRMSFHLNDLQGKPKESGTIEEWWVSPGNPRLVITSPSYSMASSAGAAPAPDRESYLVHELLKQVVHPVPSYGSFQDLTIEEHGEKFGKVNLTCLYVNRRAGKFPKPSYSPMYCIEPGTNVLRLSSANREPYVLRNRIGEFLNTSVAIENTIAYGNQIAMSGNVDVLETYKPDASSMPAKGSAVEGYDQGSANTVVPGIVLAGRIVKKSQPIYPDIAKSRHVSGTVTLGAVISKAGTISTLYVIASPDENLSASALDAVRRWEYQPYLLNGQPTEVDTTVTVNYNLNGS